MLNKGYTLVEMIIVVLIVGVLAAIAMPQYSGAIERQRAQEGVQTLVAFLNAQRKYMLENGSFARHDQRTQLDIDPAATRYFNAPTLPATTPVPPVGGTAVVASIQRLAAAYILSIDDQGNITCANGAGTTCAQAGY